MESKFVKITVIDTDAAGYKTHIEYHNANLISSIIPVKGKIDGYVLGFKVEFLNGNKLDLVEQIEEVESLNIKRGR